MAGKGRGIAAFTFNVEALGITRGSMPEAQRGPAPLFPQMEYKPGPLKAGEDENYMLALKQEIRGQMKELPFNIKSHTEKSDVERYKEKYTREIKKIEESNWTPDWSCLPKELKPQRKTTKMKTDSKKYKVLSSTNKKDVLTKLDELEKNGNVKSDDEDEAKSEREGKNEEDKDEDLEGDYEDEELEEENDYIANYFEDGDDYGAGSDDNMDEATY